MQRVKGFEIPVIAEVMILRTAGMAQFLNRHFKSGLVPDRFIRKLASSPDRQKASIDIFTEVVTALKELCDGIHIVTIGAEDKLRYYLDAARLKRL
jgi:methylenetetrahydrofolate reductase (NADPH)